MKWHYKAGGCFIPLMVDDMFNCHMRDYSINYAQNNYLFTISCYYLPGAKPTVLLDAKWIAGGPIPPHLLMALG